MPRKACAVHLVQGKRIYGKYRLSGCDGGCGCVQPCYRWLLACRYIAHTTSIRQGADLYFTVGEVAQRTQLTVRTLHHYDTIGLVRPSGRSPAGYRLYHVQDIERLHAVQSLKQLGLSLEAIAEVLQGQGVQPLVLIEQQMAQVQQALEQAQLLKDKLLLVRDQLRSSQAAADSAQALLQGMQLLSSYQQFLPVGQVRRLLSSWRRARGQWQPLALALQQCQQQGLPADAPEVQQLAQQWMHVAMAVFGGQLSTIRQWADMHKHAPQTAAHMGLDTALLAYLEQAIGMRMAALLRHMSAQELEKLDGSLGPQWVQLAADAQALVAAGVAADTPQAQALASRYAELLHRTVRHDAALAEKMRRAYHQEPILSHGHYLSPALRNFLEKALDPDVT